MLGLDDGRPLLLTRTFAKGTVLVSGLAFAARWSSLPLTPVFLALAQALALPPAADEGIVRLLAGERLQLPASGPVAIRAITGAALDWQGQADADRTAPPFPRIGVYAIRQAHGQLVASVRADPGEGSLELLPGPLVPACGGIVADLSTCKGPAQLVASWQNGRSGTDLAPWLVVLAVAAVLAEGLIANASLVAALRPQPGRAAPSSGASGAAA